MKKKSVLLVLILVLLWSVDVCAEDSVSSDEGAMNITEIENDNQDSDEEPSVLSDVGNDVFVTDETDLQQEEQNLEEVKKSEEKHYGWFYNATEQKWYYYNQQGSMQTGWQYIGGTWYYLDGNSTSNPGAMLSNCEKKINGGTYFFDRSGAMQTGWVYRTEGWYYTDNSGVMQTGWQYIGGVWYYLDAGNTSNPGVMVRDCIKDISGQEYQFAPSGAMQTGWLWVSGKGWKYANAAGYQQTGWQYIGGVWYYLDIDNEKLMVANDKKLINGKTYFFNSSGAMQTGWIYRTEGWYYADESGAMKTNWQYVGNKWYYLDASDKDYPGIMVRNCNKIIGNKKYTFVASGEMLSGWFYQNGSWYYYDEFSGQQVSGWKEINGIWYYMDPGNGNKMVANRWEKVYNKWYCFDGSGAMKTYWMYSEGLWYYLGGDGAMRTGWQAIDGDWYYFYTANNAYGKIEGEMAKSVKIEGWQLSSSGAMVSTAQMKMQAKAQMYASSTSYLILVDRAACKVGIFTGSAGAWNINKYWSCSPGAPSTPTIAGTFKVGSKGYYFDSGSSRCFWYTQFRGNYLFHSVLYNKYNTSQLNDGRLGMHLSHGCVRLDINNAKWIYDNIPRNTTVVVY